MDSYIEKDKTLRQAFLALKKPARYGTAGFRDLAQNMPYICFRVGAFVAVLNRTSPSLSLGVVISASHNKIQDNGVKIANFNGNMLQMHYENILQNFVMEEDLNKAVSDLKQYLTKEQTLTVFNDPAITFIGGDTRPSTKNLLDLVTQGLQSQGGKALNFGQSTTPQLQYYVYLFNNEIKPKNIDKNAIQFGVENIRELYWKNFTDYFKTSAEYLNWTEQKQRTIDCANGIGGLVMPHFNQLIEKYLKVEIINNDKPQLLNDKCGADFIKTQVKFPLNYAKRPHNSFVSYDGDADRIVFFTEENNNLRLIDGDRQGTVLTSFYKKLSNELLEKTNALNKLGVMHLQIPCNPTIGFVQTYYANYSSSEYLKKTYGMEPTYAATGVKFLHEKAQHYDIGIYYEANGHGTVIFSKNYITRLEAVLQNQQSLLDMDFVKGNQSFVQQLKKLYRFVEFYVKCCKLANPSVGDAITNFLLFEIALHYLQTDYNGTLSLYTDLKSKTSKIEVKNKHALKVTEIEDKVVEPEGLQTKIQNVLAQHNGKKAFLRASGTENVLRLHVEAQTVEQVEAITKEITAIVKGQPRLN